jgi:hypothetical protein
LLSVPVRFLLLLTFIFFLALNLRAKEYSSYDLEKSDSLIDTISNDSLFYSVSSSDSLIDSSSVDTAKIDSTIKHSVRHKEGLKEKVKYSAEDSMMISVKGEKLFLYGKANVKYLDIDLTADYIMLDMSKEEVFARGSVDTAGKVTGAPVFKQGSESFDSDSMKYNFKTKKGITYHIISKQGDGYLHSDETKRLTNGYIDVLHGKYTTCDAKHPHFYIAMTKAIVIPEDKIITGPAYLVLADVPFYFPFIPFGFFPNTTTRSSGIIIPSYGNAGNSRGFYLSNGGWYQVLGEHADVTLKGDIYSKGSWGITMNPRYMYRYRFNGSFTFSYAVNKNNDDITYPVTKDYKVTWSHATDSKATPGQNFSASVNYSSSKYDEKNSYNPKDYLSGSKTSSISFTRSWPESKINFSLSANATQNTQTKITNLNFPTGSLNMGSIYPLRKKSGTGNYKWWENITFQYSSQFQNTANTYDSILFRKETLDKMRTGFKQNIPLSVNFKLGKMITIAPSLNYAGMLYTKYVRETARYFPKASDMKDTLVPRYDTIKQVSYLQGINPSVGISFTPKLYGMLVSKNEKSYIMAIRHVMSPSASFSFTPDMRNVNPNYYDSLYYYKNNGARVGYGRYSRFGNSGVDPYGVPTYDGKYANLSLSLSNNLEMKVRPRNDTTNVPRKVSILDRLDFATNYHPFNKEYKWDDLTMATGTKFFKKNLGIQVNSRFSPYATDDSTGHVIPEYLYKNTHKLLRLTDISVTGDFTLKSKQGQKKGDNPQKDQPNNQMQQNNYNNDMDYAPVSNNGQYVDFNVPWSASINYSWSYSKANTLTPLIKHTIGFNGDFSLTQKWKVSYGGGYDIKAKKATSVNLNISRDLHCWQMSFSVVPFGKYAFYSFTINAKSSLLRDLKYDKKSDYRYDRF